MRYIPIVLLCLTRSVVAGELPHACSPQLDRHEYLVCVDAEAQRLDKALTQDLSRALKRIDERADMTPEHRDRVKQSLRSAQRQWIAFRKSECNAVMDAVNGTGRTIEYLECVIDYAKSRRDHLARYW